MRKKIAVIGFVLLIAYVGSYLSLRVDKELFFYKEIIYARGIGSPTAQYSIASQTNYLHYLYYFPALIEQPLSWREARMSVKDGGMPIDNLGKATLIKLWHFFMLIIFGYLGIKYLRKKMGAKQSGRNHNE